MSDLMKRDLRSNVDRDEVDLPKIGDWYLDDKNRLVCVIGLGSNYVKVQYIRRADYRVHFREFFSDYTQCFDAEERIASRLVELRDEVGQLMNRVHEVTARLGVDPMKQIGDGSQTQALVVAADNRPIDDYKTDLIKAKKDILPDLFEEIKRTNEVMADYMGASLLPLQAEADQLRPAIKRIEKRIDSVDLYAGLSEDLELIRDGEPASPTEKVHLFQRRHYMDEECLVNYEVGGMEFRDLYTFDSWLARDENFYRTLPHQRCLVAFRVRRNDKLRDANDFLSFEIAEYEHQDRYTFLYIRNGEKLYRMSTFIDFDEDLFPDVSADVGSPVYFKTFGGDLCSRGKYIPERQYLDLKEEFERQKAEFDKGKEEDPENWKYRFNFSVRMVDDYREYILMSQDHVLFDDMQERMHDDMERHNRLVLVLQGLLDRSEAFHPHPPWKIYTNEGFNTALELVFDNTKALADGEAPDIDAYMAANRAAIKRGSMVMGAKRAWKRHVSENHIKVPYGNNGPPPVSEVMNHSKLGSTVRWFRERARPVFTYYGEYDEEKSNEPIPCKFRVADEDLFNVSAYKPGDFRQFYEDPRTRAMYLKWAPYMLMAEEWHAGNLVASTRGGYQPPCRHRGGKYKDDDGPWKCRGCRAVLPDEEESE